MWPLLAEKRLTLINQTPDDLPLVWADPARVTQIFNNLLTNAIKFTPEGDRVNLRA